MGGEIKTRIDITRSMLATLRGLLSMIMSPIICSTDGFEKNALPTDICVEQLIENYPPWGWLASFGNATSNI